MKKAVILGVCALLAVFALVVIPCTNAAREAARRNQCLSCLRSLGKACQMYAMDHDGTFPSKWSDLASEYAANAKIFDCKTTSRKPGSIETVDDWAEFHLVPGLTTNEPGASVLAYEPLSNHRGHGGNVVHCDGSFRWYDAAEYVTAVGKTTHGVNGPARLEPDNKATN